MKQTWQLIGRSVGTCLVIAHWEFFDIIECMIGYCTHLGHWYADYDDRLPWFGLPMLRFFLCITAISIRDIDMLVALIDYLALFNIVTLILSCLFWSLHMYRLAIVYHLIWHDWFSWLYIILIIICQIFSSISSCVDLDDIYLFCMTVYCMTLLIPCDCMSCLSMWDTHLSLYFRVTSLGQHCFPWSRIWYETCLLFDRASD